METIKATELRLGNLIRSNSSNCLFNKGIVEVNFDTFKKIHLYNVLQYLEPIPLTEKWILKFGFVNKNNSRDGDSICKNGVYLGKMGFRKPFKYCFNAESWSNKSVYLTYVHQLQNLYFALTGEELTIEI